MVKRVIIFNDNKLAVENTSIVLGGFTTKRIKYCKKLKMFRSRHIIDFFSFRVEINNISSIIGDQIPIVRAMQTLLYPSEKV